jgi:hypothetical protein
MRDVASLAVVLIILAIILAALGLFIEGAHLLLWLGIALLVGAIIWHLLGGSRRGDPL